MMVNVEQERFPCCLVWTPIPVLTWILPFVGHMGIGNSQGVIYDFAGPYYIGEGELAFGKTTRYIQLSPKSLQEWDLALAESNACYARKTHQICFQNCHSHCATVLDKIGYLGFKRWNMLVLAGWMFLCGRFVSVWSMFVSLFPATLLWGGIVAMIVGL
ncbi:hypothetical protein BASA81_009095 [Batrachochytrium salamandrivorans]|nr:hypothetical protein BASA81_009095 [Batrachochytrium salamandrivorans]